MSRSSRITRDSDAADGTGIGAPRTFSRSEAAEDLSPERVQQILLKEERFEGEGTPVHQLGQLGQALRLWEREVMHSMNDARTIVHVSREGSAESLSCQILGAHELYGMMLTAPCSHKGALAAVREDENLIFSTIYGTAAVKFTGTIRKVQFKPTPLIYVTPHRVDMREVRAKPRVSACIHATAAVDDRELPALINDIGVGGLSVAVQKSDHEFATGEQFTVNFSVSLLDVTYPLKLRATVMTIRAELTRDHPDISLAGVKVEMTSDLERLVIHAFVQERMVQYFGAVWRVLFAAR